MKTAEEQRGKGAGERPLLGGIYSRLIRYKNSGVISGQFDIVLDFEDERVPTAPVMKAWLADNELQHLEISSTNLGFVKTFTKSYATNEDRLKPALRTGGHA